MVNGDGCAWVKAAVAAFIGRGQGGGKKVYIRCAECHEVERLRSRSS